MWVRIDFKDGDSKLYDIPGIDTLNPATDELIRWIKEKEIISIDRSLIIFPHGNPQKISAAQAKDLNPVFGVCKEEFINCGEIKSFGIVDTSSEIWEKLCAPALGEKTILTPNKKLELP